MMMMTFLEKYEALLADTFALLDSDYAVPRLFFPGDEVEIERYEEQDFAVDPDGEEIKVYFADGTVSYIESHVITFTDLEKRDE